MSGDPAQANADTGLAAIDGEPSTRGIVVVTGGSGGLGRAIVREFATAGYDVAVLARGRDRLTGTVREVAATGRRALGIPCDVGFHEQVEAAAEGVEKLLGPITVWVNNAMASVFAPFLQVDPEDFERATRTTYLGFVHGTRAALERMTPRDEGVVIQVCARHGRCIPFACGAAGCGSPYSSLCPQRRPGHLDTSTPRHLETRSLPPLPHRLGSLFQILGSAY